MLFSENKDFFPTPINVVEDMVADVNWNYIENVLEPSAGSGNIAGVVKEKLKERRCEFKESYLDCIEKDENLQSVLRGKNFRVVSDDFLTYQSLKEYSLIVMNPPFSCGAKHLLKALSLQEKSGGSVICLLNAETLKNPYTNDRKELLRRLDDYGATISYQCELFSDAERETMVEVAIIKVTVPEKKRESFILEELKKAEEVREASFEKDTSLTADGFVESIVKQYNMETEAGVRLIKEYYAMSKFILNEFTMEGKEVEPILSLKLSGADRYTGNVRINEYLAKTRLKYWKALFYSEKFVASLTTELRTTFYNQVSSFADYDFTLFNIYSLRLDIHKKMNNSIGKTIVDLFEDFSHKYYWDETSKNIHYYNGWKTNKSYIIAKKVVVPKNAYSSFSGRFEPDYYVKSWVLDMEKCFCFLDGTECDGAEVENTLKMATENGTTRNIHFRYFDLTFYKKGTCHISFTNPELLKKFNIFGSRQKGWLPPSYGVKSYESMGDEEKEVIDSFEGQRAYAETVSNTDYFLSNGSELCLLSA